MAHEPNSIWVVYDSPREYPSKFVARRWIGTEPTNEVLVADNLFSVREMLPLGLIPFKRNECDNPAIVETWI